MQNDLDPKGLEQFRSWYRQHTGRMLTRANAEKAIRAYLSAVPDAEGELGQWFDLSGDARPGSCATEGCGGQPTMRLEAGGVGSNYCSGCAAKIRGLAASRLSQARVRIRPLEWSSEPPYSVARVTALRLLYSTEAVWEDGVFQYVELRGGFASGDFPTVAEAITAAQADYDARIRSALSGDTL
jgi:hypothetical protein